jgi:hypothetical protein
VQQSLKVFFESAIQNVAQLGDTDIFPFPIENHILFDCKKDLVALLRQAYSKFDRCFVQYPPSHISTLSPVGPTGFRWATQQDPFWNAYLLGITLTIASQIENARIPISKDSVFSYRLSPDPADGRIFRDDVTWRDFVKHSIEKAKKTKFVVLCDIADCYQRIYHHRLENALQQLAVKNAAPTQIKTILSHFSGTQSYGIPVGGPAARLLVELVLNLTDQLLKSHQIEFCRYADDYHIFCDSIDEAHEKLQFLSEKLLRNDGLALQKSKTRIMSAAEFIAAQSLLTQPEEEKDSGVNKLFALNLRYDPYSPNAAEEYNELQEELSKIDILGLLNLELAKSRVHGAVARRLVSAVKHLRAEVRESAILTLIENLDSLYSLFPAVAITIKACFSSLSGQAQETICAALRERILKRSYIFGTELHAAFAARILGEQKNSENEDVLVTLYNRFRAPLVRRDIILIMAKWKHFHWLSDQINDYSGASPWERRSFIIASYFMGDRGSHWRDHMRNSFNPFEIVVRDWAATKIQLGSWDLPI